MCSDLNAQMKTYLIPKLVMTFACFRNKSYYKTILNFFSNADAIGKYFKYKYILDDTLESSTKLNLNMTETITQIMYSYL